MKIVAAIFADFTETFLGGESPLLAPLAGRTVIERTLSRAMRIRGADQRCMVVRPRDEQAAREATAKIGASGKIDVLPLDDGFRPRRPLFRSGRIWNLECWRGSPLATWFDEYVEPPNAARVVNHYQCDAVLCLEGCQPGLDIEIAEGMIEHQREYEREARFVFTQAPPGLAGLILGRECLRELLDKSYPASLLTTFRPELPQYDPITRDPCYRISSEISQTAGRFTPDTIRSREQLEEAFRELGDECNAEALCAWMRSKRAAGPEGLPNEVELEITTDDLLTETTLRVRGDRAPRRHLTNLGAVDRVVEELSEYDDRLLVLGGHGDPLRHESFGEICRRIRRGGICGLGVVTPLTELSDEHLEVLLEAKVDLIEVQIDAFTAETYLKVHGADMFGRVIENVERLLEARKTSQSPQPIVAGSLTRSTATLGELEAFYERWFMKTGAAVLRDYNDYCGILQGDDVLSMRPLLRRPCARLDRRMTLLSDGRASLCGQDVAGASAYGSWFERSLRELWGGTELNEARGAHRRGDYSSAHELCGRCGEWHRP